MKIAFINPPHLPGQQPQYRLPPLGILYIATFLNKNGWNDVSVFDGETVGASIKGIVDWVVNYKADIVGIYTMTPTVSTVNSIINSLKSRKPHIKVVLGGTHITATMEEMLKSNHNIDFLIYGEGEYPFFELITTLEEGRSLEKVSNLIYYNNFNKININSRASYVKDLNSLPFPDLDLIYEFNSIKYKVPYAHFSKVTSIMASRGCPYNCTFCGVSITHGKKVRFRSPEDVIKEIKYKRHKYKVNYFVMKDSTFTINRKWAVDFCNQLKNTGLNIRWRCNTRVDKVDKELLILMKLAGCSCIGFGIESSDNKVLKNIKKNIKFTEVKKVLRWTDELNLESHCTLMIGNPDETLESIKDTLQDMKRLRPDTVSYSITRAYPGTELYENSIKRGLLKDPHWYMNKETFSSDTFLDEPFRKGRIYSDLDLEKLKKLVYFKFYFSWIYIFTIIKRAIKKPYLLMHIIKNLYPLIRLVKSKK